MAETPEELARRLEDLEVRYVFQEDQIRQLDEVVQEQAGCIANLQREIQALREQYDQEGDDQAPMEEQVPPHY
ncbi:MAG: SlyX family protein [Myxococcota bacterium]|nr:SlyX family protein [Myxococcota bacterium]